MLNELIIKRIRRLLDVSEKVNITVWDVADSYTWFWGAGTAYSWCVKHWPDLSGCETVQKYNKRAFAQSVLFRCAETNAFVRDPSRPNVVRIGVKAEQVVWHKKRPVIILSKMWTVLFYVKLIVIPTISLRHSDELNVGLVYIFAFLYCFLFFL